MAQTMLPRKAHSGIAEGSTPRLVGSKAPSKGATAAALHTLRYEDSAWGRLKPACGSSQGPGPLAALPFILAGLLLALLAACTSGTSALPAPAPTAVPETAFTQPPPAPPTPGAQSTESAAATVRLVVQGDAPGAVVRSVNFTAPISGLAALERSGLDVVTAEFSWGAGVCSIAGVGCPADDCFCGGDIFWNYLYWDGAAWQGYQVGPDTSLITATTAVEGWRWGAAGSPLLPAPRALAADAALTWLRGQVQDDGSIAGNMSASVETLLALAANGLDAATWRTADGAPSLLDYVLAHAAEYSSQGVAEAGKLAVGLAGVDACWPADAPSPVDHPGRAALNRDAGFLAWSILGTLALGGPVPTADVATLHGLALPDGGWEWSPDWGRDTNTTALAIQTLAAAGVPVTDTAIVDGLAYLRSVQVASGGFGYSRDAAGQTIADVNSTAYVLQALAATGTDAADAAWQADGAGPVDYVLAGQQPDGGVGWQAGQDANLLATQQAVLGLLGRPFPLRAQSLPACPAAGG